MVNVLDRRQVKRKEIPVETASQEEKSLLRV